VTGAENVADLRLQVSQVDRQQIAGGVDLVVRGKPAFGVAEVVQALAQREVPAGRTRRAVLGDDLNDAIRGLGAVQRGGGWPLHDLDALDVVGVEVVEPRDRARAEVLIGGPGGKLCVDAHAVDVHQRLA
jgi:hypothetical protein